MTCIAGIEHRNQVWLAGDSGIFWSNAWVSAATPKIARVGHYLIGAAGDLRCLNLVQYVMKLPAPPKRGLEAFLARDFVPAVRKSLADEPKDEAGNPLTDFELLVGVSGSLHVVSADGSVVRCRDGFFAIGSGAAPAMGVLYATRKIQPRARLICALSAAEKYTPYVRAPFTVLTL